jgi:hypothetical protein
MVRESLTDAAFRLLPRFALPSRPGISQPARASEPAFCLDVVRGGLDVQSLRASAQQLGVDALPQHSSPQRTDHRGDPSDPSRPVLAWTCGGRRRIIADVDDPAVIEAILTHLGLPIAPPPIALRAMGLQPDARHPRTSDAPLG